MYTWTHGNFIKRSPSQKPAAAIVFSRIAALPSKSHKRFGGPKPKQLVSTRIVTGNPWPLLSQWVPDVIASLVVVLCLPLFLAAVLVAVHGVFLLGVAFAVQACYAFFSWRQAWAWAWASASACPSPWVLALVQQRDALQSGSQRWPGQLAMPCCRPRCREDCRCRALSCLFPTAHHTFLELLCVHLAEGQTNIAYTISQTSEGESVTCCEINHHLGKECMKKFFIQIQCLGPVAERFFLVLESIVLLWLVLSAFSFSLTKQNGYG